MLCVPVIYKQRKASTASFFIYSVEVDFDVSNTVTLKKTAAMRRWMEGRNEKKLHNQSQTVFALDFVRTDADQE